MTSPEGPRSGSEVRSHFRDRLNRALLYPGIYREMNLLIFLEDLAWMDGRDAQLGGVSGALAKSGAWSEIGVRGAFMRMFGGQPSDHDAASAMVYASIAQAWGYLTPQRELTGQEYERLRQDARPWTASADRILADVVQAFGPPSLWRPKYGPRFPVSVAYASASLSDPLVTFDFWPDASRGVTRAAAYRPGSEPVLRNVRWEAGQFEEGFTFSPVGRTLLARHTTES